MVTYRELGTEEFRMGQSRRESPVRPTSRLARNACEHGELVKKNDYVNLDDVGITPFSVRTLWETSREPS